MKDPRDARAMWRSATRKYRRYQTGADYRMGNWAVTERMRRSAARLMGRVK